MTSRSDNSAVEQAEDMDSASKEPREITGFQGYLYRNQDRLTRIVAVGAVGASIAMGLGIWLTGSFNVATIGYAGVWLLAFVGAASILIPIPGTAAACVAAAPAIGLNPLLIGIISGSAEALGELSGYLAGVGGRDVLQKNRFYPRIRRLILKRGGLILFLAGAIPNPVFDVAGMAAGSAGYPVRKFIPVVFVAKAIKSTWIAFACYAGIGWIESFLR